MVQDKVTRPPRAVLRVSRLVLWLVRRGAPLGPIRLLQTSATGTAIPVVVLHHAGERWLVSVFGEVGWVRRLRVTGTVHLGHGRRQEIVTAVEVTDDRRAEVTLRLRQRFGVVPFVRAAFTAKPVDGIAAFQAEAPQHPVFLLDRAG